MSSEAQLGLLTGAVLGGAYEVTRLIGEGGMGAVYEATHLRLNKRVAVKVMARELASNPEALARFRREAEVTSHLGHPHLVGVIDFGTTDSGEPYLVMEYLHGEDLDHRLRRQGKLPLETAVGITRQVASALAAAHDEGIVHRDLKPGNIFLVTVKGEDDFVKVLDFGISKIKASRTKLTRASAVMGTPEYMSPEQATGLIEEIDHHADQWALGCIAWEMLSGHAPFIADNMSALFYQVIHMDPHPLSKRAPGLPPEVEPVLRRALAKQPGDRYPSIKDFARAFEAAATGSPRELTPPPVAISRPGQVKATEAYSARIPPAEPSPEKPGTIAEAPTLAVSSTANVSYPGEGLGEETRQRRDAKRIYFIIGAVAIAVMVVVAMFILWPRKPEVPNIPLTPPPATPRAPEVVTSPAPPPAAPPPTPTAEPLPPPATKSRASKGAAETPIGTTSVEKASRRGRKPPPHAAPLDSGRSNTKPSSYANPFEPDPPKGKPAERKPPKARPRRGQLVEEL